MTARLPASVLRLGFAALAVSAAGFAAFAGPQLSAPSSETKMADAPYTLTCWQEGRAVLSETRASGLAALEVAGGAEVSLVDVDGAQRTLVALGEALCAVEFGG